MIDTPKPAVMRAFATMGIIKNEKKFYYNSDIQNSLGRNRITQEDEGSDLIFEM